MCNIFVGLIYILYLFFDIKFANAYNCCIVTFAAKNLKRWSQNASGRGGSTLKDAGALLLRMQEIFFKKNFIHFYFKIFPNPPNPPF
jgi:hypothetical protein